MVWNTFANHEASPASGRIQAVSGLSDEMDDPDNRHCDNFCLYSGAELPGQLREEWFDRIFDMGLDGPEDPRVPEDMCSDRWWTEQLGL